jgi:hypothetical protein
MSAPVWTISRCPHGDIALWRAYTLSQHGEDQHRRVGCRQGAKAIKALASNQDYQESFGVRAALSGTFPTSPAT